MALYILSIVLYIPNCMIYIIPKKKSSSVSLKNLAILAMMQHSAVELQFLEGGGGALFSD